MWHYICCFLFKNDANPGVNPGATEICDSLDNNCDGQSDEGGVSGTGYHDNIIGTINTPADVTAKCLECHSDAGMDVVTSLHGMMPTPASNVTNVSGDSQKLQEINTFCIYPNPAQAGSACLGCHPTLGKYENLTAADIDCLRCHNDAYKRKFAAEPDPAKWWYATDWVGTAKEYILFRDGCQRQCFHHLRLGCNDGPDSN